MNTKSEFNRCHIPRLVVEEEDMELKSLRESLELQDRKAITRGLDEDLDDPLVSPRPVHLGNPTTGQSSECEPNQLSRDGYFAVEEMIESQMDEYDDRDGLDTRSGALAGGVYGQDATRTDRGEEDEGQIGPRDNFMPEPSVGYRGTARLRDKWRRMTWWTLTVCPWNEA